MTGTRSTVNVMSQDYCGRCGRQVNTRHDGGESINDDGRTSPWVFVEHDRERRIQSQTLGMEPCPGSGRNAREARLY